MSGSHPSQRISAVIGSLVFLVVAPGTIAGLGPWSITGWHVRPPLLGLASIRFVGVALMAVGAAVLLESFARFVVRGLGTPAPVAPPRRLVVSGLYRHLRNPMYLAIVIVIVGEALWLGSGQLLAYAVAVWLGFCLWVVGYEEPTLRRTFGAPYELYCVRVPRWGVRLGRRAPVGLLLLALACPGLAAERAAPDPTLAQARTEIERLVRRSVAPGDTAVHVATERVPFDYLYAHAHTLGWSIRVVVNDTTGCPNDALGDSLTARGWTRQDTYQADGPDGERSAYATRRVLCVLDAQWDGGDDSDSTVVPLPGCRVNIVCVPRRPEDVPIP